MVQRSLLRLLALMMVLALVVSSTGQALAQDDATPDASPVVTGDGPQLGDAVVLFSTNGNEQAQVAVTQIQDPLDDPQAEAQRGYHYVLVEVVVENLTDNVLDFSPYSIVVIDGEGFTYSPTFASRSEESVAELPDFPSDEIAGGQTVSGVLLYEVVDGATPEKVAYSDSFSRFTLLVNEGEPVPADGEAATIYNSRGEEVATYSVDEVLPALEEEDSTIQVDRGQSITGLVVTIENTGDVELDPTPGSTYVVDEFGYIYYPTFVSRSEESQTETPDFPSDTLAPGDSATGLLVYQLPTDATISYVIYQPEFTRLYVVGQPGEGAVISGDDLEPTVVTPEADDTGTDDTDTDSDDTDSDTDGTDTDTDTDDTGDVELSAECQEIQDWADATSANVALLEELEVLSDETDELPDPDELRDAADELRDAADEQEGIETPADAEDAQEAVVAFLNAYADLLDEGADIIEDGGDESDLQELVEDENSPFSEAFSAYFTEFFALVEICPDVQFE